MQAGLLGGGIVLLLGSGVGSVLYQNAQERELELKSEYKLKLKHLEKIASRSETVYTLVRDVKQGELITEDMLQEAYVPATAASSDRFITISSFVSQGQVYARADLTANTILTKALIYEDEFITQDMREGEYSFIELPSKLKVDDYIDVRIQFPTGDDYVLFSKKKVTDLLGLTVWFNVSEGEILTMSSAIVDAYVEGAKIYALPYVDEHMQDGSQITYPVKENVKELIQSSPNIVNIAKLNLEQQNRARLEMYMQQLDPTQREQLKSGLENTKNQVNQDNAQRTADERIKELNAANAQKELVRGEE